MKQNINYKSLKVNKGLSKTTQKRAKGLIDYSSLISYHHNNRIRHFGPECTDLVVDHVLTLVVETIVYT